MNFKTDQIPKQSQKYLNYAVIFICENKRNSVLQIFSSVSQEPVH